MSRHSQSAPAGPSRRRRFAPLAVVAGVGATAALALSMTGTLSAFTASITNSANTTTDGTLVMTEQLVGGTGAGSTCASNATGAVATANSYTCSTINKYGGATTLVPGQTSTASVILTNSGTAGASSFTLEPQTCTPSATGVYYGTATDICHQLTVTITKGSGANPTSVLAATPLDTFFSTYKTGGSSGPIALGAVAAGASNQYNFTVTLPAGTTNAYQGLTATQGLIWTFSAGS